MYFSYDYENRLTRIRPPFGPSINYRYDYSGNLVERRVGGRRGERVRHVYGAGVAPLAQQENGQWTDNVVVNGKLVETFRRFSGFAPNSKLFYHTDALGSVVALSNRQGRVVRTTEYDPWGKVLMDNSPTGPGGPVSSDYEFVGGYGVRRDIDNKSIMGVRLYDAGVGRFTSEDPLGWQEDLNLFRYVENNSTKLIDPLGMSYLIFKRTNNQLEVYDKNKCKIKTCSAANEVIKGKKKIPVGGPYPFSWYNPHKGSDANSDVGSYGIFIFVVGACNGCGVHSGRANKKGYLEPTEGCIRTTDDCMSSILDLHKKDKLSYLQVDK
jgi:RHS repeat-associated protein